MSGLVFGIEGKLWTTYRLLFDLTRRQRSLLSPRYQKDDNQNVDQVLTERELTDHTSNVGSGLEEPLKVIRQAFAFVKSKLKHGRNRLEKTHQHGRRDRNDEERNVR